MSENPLQFIFLNIGKLSNSIQSQLSNLIDPSNNPKNKLLSVSSSTYSASNLNAAAVPRDRDFLINKAQTVAPVTKEELGRCTWTFLHTLAAQYPDNPTRQQKRDVKELMSILSRMYPCQECADHFKEVLRTNPVQAGSHADFSQWLCYVHNIVNRSLSKPVFPCERVDARWGKLDCEHRACDLQGTIPMSLDGKPFI